MSSRADTAIDAALPEIIALIPAAGRATRMAPLPCSKEIFPLGLARLNKAGEARPKVVCHYLLEKMSRAGARKGYIVLRKGKWDIPEYCGNGSFVDMDLAYLVVDNTWGPPCSLDQAFPFVEHARIVFGFPDILFQPDDVFVRLLEKQSMRQADVALALFPTGDYRQMDMVEVDDHGQVIAMYLKPDHTDLRLAWVCAVWSSRFTKFLHDYVRSMAAPPNGQERQADAGTESEESSAGELSVGHVLKAAIDHGLHIDSVVFPTGSYIDIGTPQGLDRALRAVLAEGSLATSQSQRLG